MYFGVLPCTQPANKSSPKPRKQPKTQRTKNGRKNMESACLHFFSLNFTFLHFISLFVTQPTKKSDSKLKKQLESQRKKFGRKTA
jgi:hypothetical protein